MMQLSPNAKTVLESRYLFRDREGRPTETPDQLLSRVASTVAEVEGRETGRWKDRFFSLMQSRRFLPNSPTLMNAGKSGGQLSACFVLPIEDSLDSIFSTLKSAALIHQSGGGTGFAFSRLRRKGGWVRGTQGSASGPLSFLRIFDTATDAIKQGGARRGANMAVLRVDHPDVFEFIDCKRDGKSITNFNISVGITDEFMAALDSGSTVELIDSDGSISSVASAREIFDRIVDSAWSCGDPGVVFLDRINRFNPTAQIGDMESTNPCGEQPLLGYESCNLGSLNLGLYVRKERFNWSQLAKDVLDCVRFLDNVIDANAYPIIESRKITLRNRKIGLGVMGFADALLKLGLPYDSEEARIFGESAMSWIDRNAKRASVLLAEKRGPFPNWKGSLWQKLDYPPMRNATVSTVAPTGTISMIAGASSGIEPIFAASFERNVLDGKRLIEIHPAVAEVLGRKAGGRVDITEDEIREKLGRAWSPAYGVSVEGHVRMQAAFQRHSDSAVSKTINLPQSSTREDVAAAYLLAYRLGCKGITVYRDRSRRTQVLVSKSAESGQFCETCD